jgi:hypothetical protein
MYFVVNSRDAPFWNFRRYLGTLCAGDSGLDLEPGAG